MSHNFPYRMFPPQTETPQPDYESRRAVGGESDFYGRPQPTPSSAQQQQQQQSSSSTSSSAEVPYAAQGSDVALGLLRSYGLEPTDLARLAELPEEMLNLDSLPLLLRQLKESRETAGACPPSSATATAPLSSRRPGLYRPADAPPPPPPPADKWVQIRNQPVQYPLEHVLSVAKSRSFEQLSSDRPDHRANSRPSPASGSYKHPPSTETPLPPPSSSSCYMLDYGHQDRTADQGKQGREARYERPAHGRPASGRMPSPRYSRSDSAGNCGSGLPRDPHRAPRRAQHRAEQQLDPLPRSRAGAGQAVAAPSRKEALDFHGSPPGAFPYSCSLCDVTALSDKVWFQHINGSQHADKQLALLQRYPSWDCRMGRKSRFNDQPAKPKDNARPAHRPQTTNQNSGLQRSRKMAKKTGGGHSKVVCAKFEAQSVDEARLRTLTEPFGKIAKVLMFPCLAFVEMGSSDQAKDLEKYYSSNPAAVQGKEVTFQISSTFNFLQSSRVLSFTPAPQGEEGFSDLINIAKRFGALLYTLALPSLAFIEMKVEADAQKLIDYYSANSLKINGDVIKVGFSGEYNTLMRVSSAKKYEEQEGGAAGGGDSSIAKRSRSPSPRKGRSQGDEGHPKRSRRDEVEEERKRSSSPSRERKQLPRSSDSRSQCEEAVVDTATCPAQPGPKAEVEITAGSDPETNEAGPTQDAAELSGDESDIEGMAVIGEDGESLDDDEEEKEKEEEEEKEEEKFAVKDVKVKEEPNEEEEISDKEQTSGAEPKKLEEEEEEGEEEPNFMEFLENCITLDELGEEDEEEEEEEEKNEKEEEEEECDDQDSQQEGESKVIYFRNLPSSCYTDAEFVNLVKAHGNAVQYFLVADRREGFIQMSSWLEATMASRELGNNPGFKGSVLGVTLTHKYPSLSAGWTVLSDSGPDEEKEEEPRRSSRSSSHSRVSEKEVLDKMTSDPAESIPQPTVTEESSQISPEKEEDLASSRKCSSEETPPQEVDGLEEVASEPESKDQEKPDKESVDKTSPTADGQTQQSDKNSEGSCLEDVETKQTAAFTERLVQPQPGPAGGSVEPPKPTKPIGAEFVRPVVGYFCNLCEVIYVDEEEAKTKHCSSLTHYQKYKEHTGQDPWSS